MEKEKCIEIITNGLYEDNFYIIGSLGRKKQLFTNVYNIVSNHIDDMENDKEINQDYSFDEISESVKFALDYTTDRYLNEDLTHFFRAWFMFIYNWNSNVKNEENIARNCKSGLRLLDQNLSIKETIGIMKKCNEQMRRLSNWMPPAFEVSRHILNRIDNEE